MLSLLMLLLFCCCSFVVVLSVAGVLCWCLLLLAMVLSVVMVVSWLLFVVLFEIGWCLWCFVVGFVCNWVVFVGFCCCHLLLIVVVLLTKAIRTKTPQPRNSQSTNPSNAKQKEQTTELNKTISNEHEGSGFDCDC